VMALLVVAGVAVQRIRHRTQLAHCLRVCGPEVGRCINLRHDRCLRSYHICLAKARDFYRCANSSKIKQMVHLAACIHDRCDEIEEVNLTEALLANPLRRQHRLLPFCWPWQIAGRRLHFGKLLAPEEDYKQCKRYLCREMPKAQKQTSPPRKEFKTKAGTSPDDPKPSCASTKQNMDHACTAAAYGEGGRSAIAILSGVCLEES
jgi:hypothetical protein